MKAIQHLMISAFFVAAVAVAQSAAAASAESPFDGTWEGQMNDLPGVTLIVADAGGGQIGGVVIFYFQKRGEDGQWHVAGKSTAPLLAVRSEGKVLTFEVQHHKSHDSPEFGPNVKFRVELTGASEAILHNVAEPAMGPVKLMREAPKAIACPQCI